MDRARVWPDFDAAWIVHEDDDLVVVDKPDGVASQAADPDRPDDLVTRLKRHLEARGDDGYLGVHQRLDRDTSGVVVMTRRRAANGPLARQFEGRGVEKTYLACVTGWPKDRARAVLKDTLVEEGGRMRVGPRGAPAITRVRVVERRGDRALLELVLETGRQHQARVQLAHAGAPIAGDALYGGAAAPRLLLHAAAIGLEHPGTGARVRYQAPRPPEFDQWLESGDRGERVFEDDAALARALVRAVRRRWGLGRSDSTTTFRLVNEAGDGLPGLAVDVYGDHLVAQLYAEIPRRERVLDALFALGFDGVYLKVRPKQANVLVDTRREDLAPRLPVRGAAAPEEIVVREEGIPYRVRLGDGLATGLYLDQRANRRRVKELAAGKSVANLFAYTCAFSVAAAVGGARRTVSVDASAAALERGRGNFEEAGVLSRGEHLFVADDAFRWLARARSKGERFDLVILDPPSYSTTKHRRFVGASDYAELAAEAMAIVAPGGKLLACSNQRGVPRARFRRALVEAARAAGRDLGQLKDLPDPLDFPVAPGGESHLKAVLATLDAERRRTNGRRGRPL